MIMVGPGTGIAPFRASCRSAARWATPVRNWLFFGDRHRAQNFYYRDDLLDIVSDGLLTGWIWRSPATRTQRVYVQHKMIDYGADVWRWLEDGAHFYVCGDATRMARDVDDALTAIIRTHGGMSRRRPRDYKRELVADETLCARRVLSRIGQPVEWRRRAMTGWRAREPRFRGQFRALSAEP